MTKPTLKATPPDSGESSSSLPGQIRDNLAFFISEHEELLRSLACGSALGWVAYSACANFNTPLQIWAVPVAIGIILFSWFELWTATLVACLIWSVQILQFHAETGWLVVGLTVVYLLLCAFGHGRASAVLITPFLAQTGLGIATPLGLGLVLGKRSGWVWSALAFAWCAIHAFVFGQWRLGLLKNNQLWDIILQESTIQPQGFTFEWLKSIVSNVNFMPYQAEIYNLIAKGPVWTSLLLQWILWIVVTYAMGYLYVRKRATDKAALEYLAKASRSGITQVKKEPRFKNLHGAVAIGTLSFIIGYTILAQIFNTIKYNPDVEVIMDIVAAGLIFLPLYIIFEGYPDRGKRAKGKRMAMKAGLIKKQPRTGIASAGSTKSRSAASVGTSYISTEELTREVKGAPKLPKGNLELPSRRRTTTRSTGMSPSDAKSSRLADGTGNIGGGTNWKIGEKIDNQYTVIKEHIGGMGIVYEVVDDFSGKKYAVKSLRDDLLENKEAIERFSIEAKTWINLDHHINIVQAMMFRVVDKRPLLFMEYVDGTDLDREQKLKGEFSVAQVVEWAQHICQGMAYAHKKDVGGGRMGVIHRDLKPANLMLTREGIIKITDFGLAKVADSVTHLTRQSTGLGTLAYMPPEQLEDARNVDKRADIYAFGAVIYELLTGDPPATGETVANLTLSILTKTAKPPSLANPAVPSALDQIVMHCLEKDREMRYADFEQIAYELSQIPITPEMQTLSGINRRSTPWTTQTPSTTRRVSRTPSPTMSHRTATPSPSRSGSGSVTTSIEAIVFIDMVGSTALGSKFGDDLVLQMKELLGNIVNIESKRQNILFIKGTGDGFMLTFPEATNAARAALGIMRRAQEHNTGVSESRALKLRMGVHFGQVNVDSNGDRQGTSVNFASRIEAATENQFHQTRLGIQKEDLEQANRILISEVVNDELKGSSEFRSRLVGYFDFKGISGRHRLYELFWK